MINIKHNQDMRKIEDFLNSKETYKQVLDILNKYGKITTTNFIAGGSVSNIIISMVHGGEPVVNDIDVYTEVKGDQKVSHAKQWYPAMYVNEDGVEILDDSYGRIFVAENGARMRVTRHSRNGVFNHIEFLYDKSYKYHPQSSQHKPQNQVILEGFDLNCCKAGLDLVEEKILYTSEFVDFLKTKQLKVTSPCAPIQTAIRIHKKMKDLNCYCDVEHEMRFLTVATKQVNGGQMTKYVGPETQTKYEKYKDFVGRYFTLREPLNSDEIPSTLKDTYYIGNERNPDVNIWLFEPVMDFNIIENVGSLGNYKRMWELLYRTKKKGEQDKINKIFYKNVFLGNMTEDTWEIKEYANHSKSAWDYVDEANNFKIKPYYNSNRFTFMMLLSKKNYHKCNFDLKHVDFIDKFAAEHYAIRTLLKNCETIIDQYRLIKFIKSLAKKDGEWVIGLLENMGYEGGGNHNDEPLTEQTILKILSKEKEENSKELVEKIDLKDFYYKNCVKELITPLELKVEGTKMGHCVGGYSQALSEGRSRIFHIDCDGIGSTLEVHLPITKRYNKTAKKDSTNPWVESNIVEAYQPDSYTDECIIIYDNKTTETIKTNELLFKIWQHHGRYPEKGNLTPTDTNDTVAKELVGYLNNRYLPKNYKIKLPKDLAKKEDSGIFVS